MDKTRLDFDAGSREVETLLIVKEFNKMFKSKLCEMNDRVDLQLEPRLQDWVQDLIQQNEMLVEAVEELENESALRVSMLEDKLKRTSQICDILMQKYKDNVPIDVLNENCRNSILLQNDVRNLLEFIKRVHRREWSTDGLNFYTVDPSLLLQEFERSKLRETQHELTENSTKTHPNLDCNELHNVNLQLNLRDEELKCVEKSMMEIQDSLLIKVSEKYEENLGLQRDVQRLELEICRMSREMKLKDSSMEKLHDQIKLLKGENKITYSRSETNESSETKDEIVKQLRDENRRLTEELGKKEECKAKYDALQHAMRTLQCDYDLMKNRENARKEIEISERRQEREKHNREVANLNQTIVELESRLSEKASSCADTLREVNFTVFQQRSTISNLQDALITCKSQLEELQQKSANNVSAGWTSRWLGLSSADSKSASQSVHDV